MAYFVTTMATVAAFWGEGMTNTSLMEQKRLRRNSTICKMLHKCWGVKEPHPFQVDAIRYICYPPH